MEKDCSCGVRIRMLKNLASGRTAPITVEASSRGNVVLEGPYWRIKREGDRGPFYLNHFTDCPDAEQYGGSRAGNPAYRDDDPPARQNELFPLTGVRDYTK
jgi:hypothetical protein